ncbi:Clathrin light chain [Golovinomyces cichoracearum]|uniref:Clathrin light chain n=1 Tax=Golovinomyces cichoracearum TaxID=62708 RepID=A0A420J8R6_9PEZI|nr:Clathrin light chain [Golovinomyces cichoracearum]
MIADRFPSLEEFDTAQTEAPGLLSFEATTADDFLSREKALLGEDANQFTTQDDVAFIVENDKDLLQEDLQSPQRDEEVSMFESSFPAIDTQCEVGNFLSTDLVGTPLNQKTSIEPTFSPEEPDVIKQWRERRDLDLSERAARSEEQKQETIKNAQRNIDEFYENYNAKKEKSVAQTRREAEEFFASREDTSAGGTSWERIAKLVDLSGKDVKGGASGTDKARFRDLLMSLKKDPNAPGASGY